MIVWIFQCIALRIHTLTGLGRGRAGQCRAHGMLGLPASRPAGRRNGGPVIVREQVPLAGYTTLGLGGPAARFAEAATDADVVAAVREADRHGEPVLVLGSGSNLVIADEGFDGTVVRVATRGISEGPGGPDGRRRRCGSRRARTGTAWCAGPSPAGCPAWSACRASRAGRRDPDPECRRLRPGGRATIVGVRGWDRQAGEMTELTAAECGFGYRTSVFKRRAARRAGSWCWR